VILADTSAMIALIDADDRHHGQVRALFEADPSAWVIPWATLPEIDYLVGAHVGRPAQDAFLRDLRDGAFMIEWGCSADIERAHALHKKYASIHLGLVDGVVMAVAERLRAKAIVTLDLRHFGAVVLRGRPSLYPRDA
jgi:predicted nucleic acid-binding protein